MYIVHYILYIYSTQRVHCLQYIVHVKYIEDAYKYTVHLQYIESVHLLHIQYIEGYIVHSTYTVYTGRIQYTVHIQYIEGVHSTHIEGVYSKLYTYGT